MKAGNLLRRARLYIALTKPGIVRGNVLVAIGGFLLASNGHVVFARLVMMILGVVLIIASGCVFNNYLDRNIDKKMKRTQRRPLVTGEISVRAASIFAVTLLFLGFFILIWYVNMLTAAVGFVGFIGYVIVYGYAKRRSVHGTLIGGISGATPPVAGYVAVTNRLDVACVLLFTSLMFWQMPHFFAIAMYRYADYKAAGLPVITIKKGMHETKKQILLYIIAFTISVSLLTFFGITGWTYFVIMVAVSLFWLMQSIFDYKVYSDEVWAKKVFGISLVVLLLFSFMISINAWLP